MQQRSLDEHLLLLGGEDNVPVVGGVVRMRGGVGNRLDRPVLAREEGRSSAVDDNLAGLSENESHADVVKRRTGHDALEVSVLIANVKC